MFNLNLLIYRGKQQGIDVFDYNGIRIDATITKDRNGQYLYLGLGKGLPDYVMPGLMAWFGLDWRREFTEYRYPDKSYCFVQKQAA